MAIKGALFQALIEKAGSQQALSRLALQIQEVFGPNVSGDEARLVLAQDWGIRLSDYGVPGVLQERVRVLRTSGASLHSLQSKTSKERPASRVSSAPTATVIKPVPEPKPPTPATQFLSRDFHEEVIKRCRKLFSSGHRTEAISAAFRSVNNRVKQLSGIKGLDGVKLMNQALSEQSPALRLNAGSDRTELDEQQGLRFLMVGAMLALRNPRVHEDDWSPDRNVDAALECLGYASLLHRLLDRCQEFEAKGA